MSALLKELCTRTQQMLAMLKQTSNESARYTVDELIAYAKGKATVDIDLSELEWQYPHARISKVRLAKIVIDGFPIIVTRRADGSLATLDGFHRTYKAIKEGRKTIKGVVITEQDQTKLNRAAKE